jgi:hypothetical protein
VVAHVCCGNEVRREVGCYKREYLRRNIADPRVMVVDTPTEDREGNEHFFLQGSNLGPHHEEGPNPTGRDMNTNLANGELMTTEENLIRWAPQQQEPSDVIHT